MVSRVITGEWLAVKTADRFLQMKKRVILDWLSKLPDWNPDDGEFLRQHVVSLVTGIENSRREQLWIDGVCVGEFEWSVKASKVAVVFNAQWIPNAKDE